MTGALNPLASWTQSSDRRPWSIRREHLKIALTPAGARPAIIRFGIGNVAYAAAIGIAFLNAPASLLVSALVAACYVFEQTPSRDPGASTTSGRDEDVGASP